MSAWFLHREFQSEKNGRIIATKFFGIAKVIVDGYEQSGRYLKLMWCDALRRLGPNASVKRVLMLGLAGGISVPEVYARFPSCEVVAIEWDPVMVEIAKVMELVPVDRMPRVIIGDAYEELPKIESTFDLILIDMFHGGIPEPRLASDEMVGAIKHALAPGGAVILNAFKTMAFLPAFSRGLRLEAEWKYEYNTIALFR